MFVCENNRSEITIATPSISIIMINISAITYTWYIQESEYCKLLTFVLICVDLFGITIKVSMYCYFFLKNINWMI